MKSTRLLRSIVAVVLLGATAARADYDIQTFEYPGADGTTGFGINSRGLVVGNAQFSGGPNLPFVYNYKKQQFTPLAPVAGFGCT